MRRRSRVSRAFLGLFLASLTLLSSVPAQIVDANLKGCVLPGESLQEAIDKAPSGGTVKACPGVHAASLVLRKNVTLEGLSGAILDGSTLVGTRHAVRLVDGASGATVRGFEIRGYRNAMSLTDASAGITSLAPLTGVRIEGNTFRDNGWAGLVVAGGADGWSIRDNAFHGHAVAHLLAHDATRLRVEGNTLGPAPHGILLSGTRLATVHDNDIEGGGRGGIVATPLYRAPGMTDRLALTNNTVTGEWTHGIWVLGAKNARIVGNEVDVEGAGITLGGSRGSLTLAGNDAPSIAETDEVAGLLAAFRGPSAAKATPVAPSAELLALLEDALLRALNPLARPGDASDHAALAACAGAADACLTERLFMADGHPPRAWSAPLTVGGATAELRFIDAGVRGPGDALARHHVRAELDQAWTTLVLCRIYIGGVPYRCDVAPTGFTYGLDVTWAESPYPQGASLWRLKLPTDLTFDSLDRLHAQDATLFKLTRRPHHAESASTQDPASGLSAPVADPLRTAHAGSLTLRCAIVLPGGTSDCKDPVLVTRNVTPTFYWCGEGFADEPPAVHADVLTEASTHWSSSKSCGPVPADVLPATSWSHLLGPSDLADLARAQDAYYKATTPTAREGALALAENVFERAVARHLAIGIPGEGMPTAVDTSALRASVPTLLPTRLSGGSFGTVAVWDGRRAILHQVEPATAETIWGRSDEPRTHRRQIFDPATLKVTNVTTTGTGTMGTTGVWDGLAVTTFGDHLTVEGDAIPPEACPEDWDGTSFHPDPMEIGFDVVRLFCHVDRGVAGSIKRFDPALGVESSESFAAVEDDMSGASAVWDARDRPHDRCLAGCAYVFGGARGPWTFSDDILQHNPATRTLTTRAERLPHGGLAGTAAVWTGEQAFLFGGARSTPRGYSNEILRFDPDAGTLVAMGARFPTGLAFASAAWDGETALIFGGSDGAQPLSTIYRYYPRSDRLELLDVALPRRLAGTAAVWDGGQAWVFGGTGTGPSGESIIRVPLANTSRVSQAGADFRIVELKGGDGEAGNVVLHRVEVRDAAAGWLDADVDGLVALTPVRLTLEARYVSLNGDLITKTFTIVMEDRPSAPAAASTARFGDETYVEASATDPDNLDYAHAYLDASRMRTHTVPLVDVRTLGGDVLSTGIARTGARLPAGAEGYVACSRDLWTAQANGASANLEPADRLAVAPSATCATVTALDAALLKLQVPVVVSLELREADADTPRVSVRVAPDAFGHAARASTGGAPVALSDPALTATLAGGDLAVGAASVRVLVEVPRTMEAVGKATLLADLVAGLHDRVGIFAVEVDDLPMTTELERAIGAAIEESGVVVLVGAGRLPAGAWTLPPEDKLMTIHGLAASSLVLTIGSATRTGGVDAWSRLGPTPGLLPKPDLVAPSLAGTTGGAVASVLPYAEALVARGLRHPGVVRAALAGHALPTTSERGTPATFWEQGFGVLDLSTFLLPVSTADLLERGRRLEGAPSTEALAATLAIGFGARSSDVTGAPPERLLALALPPGTLLRGATGASLARLALDTPALPASASLDFGVVNHARKGEARFGGIDYDGVLNATSSGLRVLLAEAGYAGPELEAALADVAGLVAVHAEAGQDVTLDATFYELTDLIDQGDYLYASYLQLVRGEASAAPEAVDAEALAALEAELVPWLFEDEYRFMETTRRRVHMPAELATDCRKVPVAETQSFASRLVDLVARQVELERGRPSFPAAESLRDRVIADHEAYLARDRLRFTASQAEQAMCLEDQRRLLEDLRGSLVLLRNLRQAPAGAWGQAEEFRGTWGETALGAQLANATTTLGVDPADLATNSTLILDVAIEAAERAIRLIDETLDHVGMPDLVVTPDADAHVETVPARTADAPLGPYVGLATMTSRNVTVYDPFTRAPIGRRDVTIPIPAFLFNNPTVVFREAYRDDSAYAGGFAMLFDPDGGVFEEVTRVARDEVDGVVVDLSVDASGPAQGVREEAAGALERVRALATAQGLGPFEATYAEHLERYAAQLEAVSSGPVASPADEVNGVVDALYSRLDHQMGLLDAEGQVPFHHLLPGRYSLYSPYDYWSRFVLDVDHPYLNPGRGSVAQPLLDPDAALARVVRGTTDDLRAHPSAAEPQRDVPTFLPKGSLGGLTLSEIQCSDSRCVEVPGFRLALQGPDHLHVHCRATVRFAEETGTPLSYAGCNALPLGDVGDDALRARAFADCVAGRPHDPLGEEDASRCRDVRAEHARATAECGAAAAKDEQGRLLRALEETPPGCARHAAFTNVTGSAAQLASLLGELGRTGGTLRLPWARSPARLLAEDPAEYGYTPDALFARSRPLNPPEVADADVWRAVNATLAALPASAGQVAHVQPPARVGHVTHTLAQGFLSHVTDKINGQDWTHVEPPSRGNAGATTEALLGEVALAAAMASPASPDDAAVLRAFHDATATWAAAAPADFVAAFESGLAQAPAVRAQAWAEGWRPNGTVTRGGWSLPERVPVAPLPAQACLDQAVPVAALQPAYLACHAIQQYSAQDLHGLGGIDRVAFANALLEGSRPHAAALTDGNASRERVRSILTTAAALASSSKETAWTRANEGITMGSASLAPAIGLLMYSTPVPENEHLTYRIDGEFLLKNTAALVVTTANPAVTRALTDAIQALEPPPLTDAARYAGNTTLYALETVEALSAKVELATGGGDTLTRVDLLGLPVGIEERAWARAEESGARGLATLRTETLYNYTRYHEMGTKGREVEAIYVLIAYFPSAAPGQVPLPQKASFANATLQFDTYVGFEVPDPARRAHAWSMSLPIRYRDNVEDWTFLSAIPDQPLARAEATGMRASVVGAQTIPVTPERLLPGPTAAWTATLSDGTRVAPIEDMGTATCPDSNAPGFGNSSVLRARAPGGAGFLRSDPESECGQTTVASLAPQRETRLPQRLTQVSDPPKRLADASEYVVRADPRESQSAATPMEGMGARSRPSGAEPPTVPGAGGGGSVAAAVTETLAATLATVDGALWSVPGLADAAALLPYRAASFDPSRQSGGGPVVGGGTPVLHNYVVLRNADARRLMADPWSPASTITFVEETAPEVKDIVGPGLAPTPHAQVLTFRNDTLAKSGVLAHSLQRTQVVEDAKVVDREVLEVLAGHGLSGAGLAVRVSHDVVSTLDDASEEVTGGARLVTTSRITIEAYALGGSATGGSDCGKVPAFHVARPHFRCTGYDAAGVTYASVVHGEPLACVQSVQDAIDLASARMAHQSSWSTVETHLGAASAVSDLLHPLLTASEGRPQPASALSAHGTAALEAEGDIARAAVLAALACVPRSAQGAPLVAPVLPEGEVVRAAMDELRAGIAIPWAEGDVLAGSARVRAFTAMMRPALASHGEPPRDVVLSTDLKALAERSATTLLGDLLVNFTAEDLSTNLSRAWLNVTTTWPNGTTTRGTLGTLHGTGGTATQAGRATLRLDEGARYAYEFLAIDTFGQRIVDRGAFVADTRSPVVLAELPATLVTNALTIDVAFLVRDEDSGLRRATLTRREPSSGSVAGASWVVATADLARGTREGVDVRATLDLANVSQDKTLTLTLVAEDMAGNVRSLDAFVRIDRLAPAVNGAFLDVVSGVVPMGTLSTEALGVDSGSGIASLRIVLYNVTGGMEEDTTVTSPDQGRARVTWQGWPGATYKLNVTATDHAGNRRTQTVATARVEVPPAITSVVPAFRYQGTTGVLTIVGGTSIPGFEGLPPDEAWVRVLDGGAVVHETRFARSALAGAGVLSVTWSPPHDGPRSYVVSYQARLAGASTWLNATVNVTAQEAGAFDLSGHGAFYGTLAGAADAAVFRLARPSGCGDAFAVRLVGRNAGPQDAPRDVDLFVGQPADPADPAGYGASYTDASPEHEHAQAGAPAGTVWHVRVATKEPGASFSLTHARGCGSGGGEADAPSVVKVVETTAGPTQV